MEKVKCGSALSCLAKLGGSHSHVAQSALFASALLDDAICGDKPEVKWSGQGGPWQIATWLPSLGLMTLLVPTFQGYLALPVVWRCCWLRSVRVS